MQLQEIIVDFEDEKNWCRHNATEFRLILWQQRQEGLVSDDSFFSGF